MTQFLVLFTLYSVYLVYHSTMEVCHKKIGGREDSMSSEVVAHFDDDLLQSQKYYKSNSSFIYLPRMFY